MRQMPKLCSSVAKGLAMKAQGRWRVRPSWQSARHPSEEIRRNAEKETPGEVHRAKVGSANQGGDQTWKRPAEKSRSSSALKVVVYGLQHLVSRLRPICAAADLRQRRVTDMRGKVLGDVFPLAFQACKTNRYDGKKIALHVYPTSKVSASYTRSFAQVKC